MLSGIGMSPDNLSAFTHRLKVIAQRHGIKPEVVCNMLMNELEQLDEGLGLDTVLKTKKGKLRRLEEKMMKTKEESAAISSTNEKLREERSSSRAALLEERKHITKDIKVINAVARSTITTKQTSGCLISF